MTFGIVLHIGSDVDQILIKAMAERPQRFVNLETTKNTFWHLQRWSAETKQFSAFEFDSRVVKNRLTLDI
jgi:hypothetical protein